MPDTVGNNLATAKTILPIASSQTFQEFVGVENGVLDSSDYYRFTLTRSSSVTLSLRGLGADANFEIVNSAGTVVTDANGAVLRSTNTGALPEAITTILSAGTYYVHISPGPATDPANPLTTPSTNYSLGIAANNGARSDIFWRNYATGQNSVWFMEGTGLASFALTTSAPDTAWTVQATGDMDGDGDGDVVWRNTRTGENSIWLMNGAVLTSAVVLPANGDPNYQIGGVGDFNKDGKNDILWRNYATGQNVVWFMNGPVFTGSFANLEALPSNNFRFQGVADFNNDGNVDILIRDYTSGAGGNIIWLMNGTNRVSTVSLPAVPDLNYQIQGTGDFNLDGKPDILFRNVASGQNVVWFLDGTTFAGFTNIQAATDLNYQAKAPLLRYTTPTQVDLAGNTTTNAFAIGPLNGNGLYRDAVSGSDTNDYYRFFLGSPTNLNLQVSGLNNTSPTGDLVVQILDSTGSVVSVNGSLLQSDNPGNTPENIATNLDPGNYFIRVAPKSAADSSAYELSLAVNNLPVLATKSNLLVSEGTTQTIGSNLLLVTDENNTPNQLTYSLISPLPTYGNLSVNGTLLIAGSTFTQADINAGKLTYTQDGSETLVDRFVFNVQDGVGGIVADTTFTINTVPVNDAPTLVSNQPLAATEGQAVALTSNTLLVTDVEQPATQIAYSLNSLPTSGSLILNGSTLSAGGTFTQADVNSGTRLQYRHNGSETSTDTFTFSAIDGAGGALIPPTATFSINVAPVNDAPVLTTNLGLTVNQDATSRISSTLLTATDAEFLTLPDQVVYTVVTGPTRGTLYRNGTATNTFTQADLNNGTVSYDHDGSNTNSDSFTFRVTDGVNTVPGTGLPPASFNITVNRVNFVPVLVTNAGLSITEGTTAAISNTLLRITDQDNPPPQIVYTLQSVPTHGTLKRVGTPMTVGQTFTQDDLDQATSRISYQHDGSETPLTDSFTFTASDGSSANIPTATFSINVTPANDAPVLTVNTGAALAEGGSFLINSSVLQITDNDGPTAGSLFYSLTTAPSNGTLFLGSTAVTTFTQADVNSGQLRYSHNGSESVSDSLQFTITDGVITTPVGPNRFNIAIAPVNDIPRVSLNTGLTLSEGASSTIANTALLVTDTDGPSPVSYTIGSLPGRGTLLLAGTALATGQTFTQTDVDSGRLSYVHDGSETTSDRFTFTASDGSPTGTLALTTFSINVTSVNDAPVLINNTGATLLEGGSAQISNTALLTTDNDNPLPAGLVYSVTTAPTQGTLLLGTTAVTTFTQADVNSGQLRYSHSGSETVSDSFSFTVTDGVVTTPVGPSTFNLSITPVNDIPRVSLNAGLTLSEGASSTIANTALLVTDTDGPSLVSYTIGSLPGRGTLLLGGTTLATGQTFSQTDIDSGLLSYIHDGSETTSDRFTFTASDGSPTGTLALTTFSINVTSVNDAPVLVNNTGATLLEGGSAQISNTALLSTDNDNPLPAGLVYSVTTAPTQGTLLLGTTAVTTFTQADINSGQLKYSHSGSETVSDSFSFTVTDGVVTTPVGPSTFNLSITSVNDAPKVSLNTGLTLSEGASTTIANTALLVTDPDGPNDVTYTLGSAPNRGTLLLGATPLTAGQTFTQIDINNGQLSYLHNGSETTSDRFTFTASDGSTGNLALTTFNIGVTAVNDAPTLTLPTDQVVNEDTQLIFGNGTRIRLSDAENNSPISVQLSVANGILTVNSGAGVTNNNTSSVVITGSATAVDTALNNLVYTPGANFNGPDALTIAASDGTDNATGTINITVAAVNDAPTLTVPGTQTVDEDAALVLTTITTNDIDSNGTPVRATLSALNGTLSLASTAGVSFINGTNGANSLTVEGTIASIQGILSSVSYQGNANYNGADTISITINDQGATGAPGALSVTKTIPVTVRSVNDTPTFTGGVNQVVNEDAGTQTVTGWATDILRGPANESAQTLSFAVSNDNPNLFTTAGQPKVDPATGNLIYTAAANAFGTATVTVRLQDSGGTALGGDDTSDDYTFTITVNPVNDAPTFTKGANITIAEDSPAQSIPWATNISSGPGTPLPPNESGQTVNFLVSSNNPDLFTIAGQPAIAPNGTLTYTLAPDANGIAIVTVGLRDNGGTDNGGVDTSALQTFTINATAVNDAPTLTLPGTQTLDEDAILGISGVSINDVDSGSGSLRVTLTALGTGTPSTGGNLSFGTIPGVAVTGNNSSSVTLTGNLTNLNAALSTLNYQGKPNINGQDRVVISVNDQGNSPNSPLTATQTLTVNVTPVNDAPVLTVTGGNTRTGLEDNLVTLSGLSVSDVDSDPGNLEVTVSVLQGVLTSGTGTPPATIAGTGTATLTITGTRASVNSALNTLRYQGAANFYGSDEATITVSDLGNTGVGGTLTDTKSLTINVTPVNDAPVFVALPVGPLPVVEDTDLTFDGARAIVVTDVDSGANPVRLTLSVNSGKLTVNPAGLNTISGANNSASVTYEGTIDAIAAALSSLVYRGNLNYTGADRLTITVNDNGFTGSPTGTPITRTVDLNVTAFNDPPVLVTNNPLTLNEGASQSISNGLLRTTDVDNLATEVVYTLSTGAASVNGSLVRSGITLAAGGTFTQDDVNRGLVRYVHSGSETTLDSFTFSVNDGGTQPTTAQFNIRINPINDNPVLANRQPLSVTEGQSGTISTTLLQVTDPDNTVAQLRYTVTNLPSSGFVRLNGSNLSAGQTFTQQDVNLNRVTYRHNGSETTSDSFTFTVSDGAGGSIGSTVFNIGVSPVNDAPLVVSNGPLTISEGAVTNITRSILQTTDPESQPLTYTLVAQPQFGILTRNGAALANGQTFTQADIDTGLISYRHDGSETPENKDAFFYSVTDGTTSINRIFNVNVTPTNDAPVLLTHNPSIEVAGDVASVTEIGSGLLQVTDVDNTPDQIVYRLVAAPNSTFGQLELNGTALVSGQSFTQADVDAGRVVYRSPGGGSSDSFQFSVSDGGAGGTLNTEFFNILFTYPDV